MCYEEMAQCGGSSSKAKKSKAQNKKIKTKTASAAVPAKSKDLLKVEVKADGSSTKTNKTGQRVVEAIDADSFLSSLALEDGLDFDAYPTKRSRQEWEKLVVSMAGKIYGRQV